VTVVSISKTEIQEFENAAFGFSQHDFSSGSLVHNGVFLNGSAQTRSLGCAFEREPFDLAKYETASAPSETQTFDDLINDDLNRAILPWERDLEFYWSYLPNLEYQTSSVQSQFKELAALWHDETDAASSPTVKLLHPAYLKIIALGKAALPFIFEELARQPAQWFVALESITRENPVPQKCYDTRQAVQAWLDWGKTNRYIR